MKWAFFTEKSISSVTEFFFIEQILSLQVEFNGILEMDLHDKREQLIGRQAR